VCCNPALNKLFLHPTVYRCAAEAVSSDQSTHCSLCLAPRIQHVAEHAALLAILLLLLLLLVVPASLDDADDVLLQLSLGSKALGEPAAQQQQQQQERQ
jgi:hypothetical protein